MPYTWTTQIHNTTAGRTDIHVETWVLMPHGWENIDIVQADTLYEAHKTARTIRSNHTFQTPAIIAAVKFAPRGHHRLVTWHGNYNEGDTNA